MKIALVNNYYYLRGGSERVLFGHQQALTEAGHEVVVFAAQHSDNQRAPSSNYFPVVTDRQVKGHLKRLRAAAEVIYSPSVGRAFGRFLDDCSPDVIHFHNIYSSLTTAVLDEAKRREIPCVLTTHDLKLVCPSYLGLRQGQRCLSCVDNNYWRCVRWKCHKNSYSSSLIFALESYSNRLLGKYNAVRRFLCPSNFLRSALLESGVTPERALYHPNALSVHEYEPSFTPGNYILYAGRLSAEKGLLTLLEASARMAIPLRIAGTGPLEERLKKQIAAQGLPVTLEGYRSGTQLQELYRNAAFTVVPSVVNESFGLSALESLAYGKPVIASRVGGLPEIFVDEEMGLFVTPRDSAELAEAINSLWFQPNKLVQMGRSGRAHVEKHFNQERRASDLIEIYRKVKLI